MVGYTPKQAERLRHKIDIEVAKIDDALHRMSQVVPDFGQHEHHPNNLAEMVRENQARMDAVIERRTRKP